MQGFPKLINNTAKACCEIVSVKLRKLIFHICFEHLGFVGPVKLFEKQLAGFSLKAPRKFAIPTLNSL
jgi:hypothetical protein